MAEADPLDLYEAELEHDFGELSKRIKKGLRLLDVMAHITGPAHRGPEYLCISRDQDGVLEGIHFEDLPNGLVVVSTHDPEGWTTSYHRVDVSHIGAFEQGESDDLPAAPFPQLGQMLVVASLAEECNYAVMTAQANIKVYEK